MSRQDNRDEPGAEGAEVDRGDGVAEVVELSAVRERPEADAEPDAVVDGGSGAEGVPAVQVNPPGSDRVRLADRMRRGERRPVLPGWARSADEFRTAAAWVASHYAHTTAYHGVRAPVYSARLTLRAPAGLIRVVSGGTRWLFDTDGIPVRLATIRREDSDMYLKLERHRDARVRSRTLLTVLAGITALVLSVMVVSGFVSAPAPVWWLLAAVIVGILGRVGSPVDKPIAGPAVVAPQVTKLTADIVIRALAALGIAGINQAMGKGREGIAFVAPITRDGPGWRADLDLPYGVTVSDIMARRDKLASGLRRPQGCVWPEASTEAHAGRLVLWVGDQDMAKAPATPWPLSRKGTVDLFQPIPVGADPRGRIVKVSLIENNILIGSLPGGGKTATARVYLLAAGLDPTSEVWGFNLKSNSDIASAKKFAHRYAAGQDDGTIELVVQALRDLKVELQRRADVIKGLPVDVCPDGKVTRALANRPGLGLHGLVCFIDECQNLFSHSVFGKEAGELAQYIIKLGRALGIILILATQRPDKDSLPTGVSANVSIRFCLRVMGQTENDMILGTSMYQNGIRATEFRPSDRGIGYLLGASDDPQIVRSAYIDLPEAELIADRARAARIAAGRLAGFAVDGTNPGTTADGAVTSNLLDDIAAALAAIPPSEGEAKVWSETIVVALAELRPALYEGWTPEILAGALKPYGIETVQVGRRVEGKVVNRRGIARADIARVMAERDRRREAS